MFKAIKLLQLFAIIFSISGCVGLDRMLAPIENHTHHYTFTHSDIVRGGVVAAGLTDSRFDMKAEASSDFSSALTGAFYTQRKEFQVRSAESLQDFMSAERYQQMMNQYKTERWIHLDIMAEIREHISERYVMFARVEDTSQSRSTSCSLRKKKKKKDKDGNETDEYEDGPDVYDLYRYSTRSAEISADVFDLAQDIIVWSGTREESTGYSRSYETDHYVVDGNYVASYPYPDYPSWHSTFESSIEDLVLHMPHRSD